jgi:hypothetical protein
LKTEQYDEKYEEQAAEEGTHMSAIFNKQLWKL